MDNEDSNSQEADSNENSNQTQFIQIENVIKKLIRVLSNAAISPENGSIIIQRDDCIDLLFKILSKFYF